MLIRVVIAMLCCGTVIAGCSRMGGAFQPLPTNLSNRATQLGATSLATERALYKFKGGSDAARPLAGLTRLNGALYGTTAYGGMSDNGTVFKVSPSGTETVLYRFKGGLDGSFPTASLVVLNGTLYGTTQNGGASGDGTVFKVSATGAERVLYSFKGGTDGALPKSELIAQNGILYGTTYFGGNTACFGAGCGTVFKITTSGNETVLYRFLSGTDGAAPDAGLVAANGNFYGTTLGGSGSVTTACPDEGVPGCGTVFEVSPTGVERVLRDFKGGSGARNPVAPVLFINGWLYGSTAYGGGTGNGTIFKLNSSGTGYKILYSFTGAADGSVPNTGLTELGGVLYGTTAFGNSFGGGTVFKISPTGAFGVVYDFVTPSGGYAPNGKLVALNGVLYGTTYSGGTGCSSNGGCGTVYAITP